MPLSPEDKQRIYEEEQTREQARDTIRQKRAVVDTQNRLIGCGVLAVLAVVIYGLMRWGPLNSEKQIHSGIATSSSKATIAATDFGPGVDRYKDEVIGVSGKVEDLRTEFFTGNPIVRLQTGHL